MLSRNERIKYSGLFQQAFEKGKFLKSKHFRVHFTKTLDQYADRLPLCGFVVSKNYSKKAVLRNRIKRQIREIYRLYRLDSQKTQELKKIGLLVIAIRGQAENLKASFKELQEELEELLNQAA